MDGKKNSTVIEQGPGNIWPRSPFSLAYDREGDRLLWQDVKAHSIKAVDRSTGKLSDWEINPLPDAAGDLCVDQQSRTVYFHIRHFGRPDTHSIGAGSLETGEFHEITPRSTLWIQSIDHDPVRNELIYTRTEGSDKPCSVWRHRLANGICVEVMPANEKCRGIGRAALHPSGRRLYWCQNSKDDSLDGIWSIALERDAKPEPVVRTGGSFPFEIEFTRDWKGSIRLIWTDITKGSISSCKLDGSDVRVVNDLKKAGQGKAVTGLELVRRLGN